MWLCHVVDRVALMPIHPEPNLKIYPLVANMGYIFFNFCILCKFRYPRPILALKVLEIVLELAVYHHLYIDVKDSSKFVLH